MNRSKWDSLSIEIINKVYENLENDHSIEYRLVNKHCYLSSLSLVYRSISVTKNNKNKLASFHSLLKTSLYDLGQFVKQLEFHSVDNLHVLEMLMTHCPNVLKLSIIPIKEVHDCVVSTLLVTHDPFLWSDLQEVKFLVVSRHSIPYITEYTYEIAVVFCQSLTRMELRGKEKELHSVLENFRQLKKLQICYEPEETASNSVFDCEELFKHCPSALHELTLYISPDNYSSSSSTPQKLSRNQRKVFYNYTTYANIVS